MDDIVSIEHVQKIFPYINPDPNSNESDMWVAYLLGLLGLRRGQFSAQRERTVALADISLTVRREEFFGLLGPNGAGKTTLIKVLSTILLPNAGRILVNGFDTVRDAAKVRASLSIVPASGWLSFDQQLTLIQNLVFWGRLCGLGSRESLHRARAALDIVDLDAWRDETPNHLSSGMRQRLAIVKGLLVRAPVFVLDEPTANVDPIVASQVRDFLRNDLNRKLGQTIILATHNMAEAEQLCDRIAIIDHGCVLVCDRPTTLTAALAGRVIEVKVNTHAARALSVLREVGIARHIVDTIDDDDSGRFRLLLQPDVSSADVQTVLNHHSLGTSEVADALPMLEDVFMHYAGRNPHVDHSLGTDADL